MIEHLRSALRQPGPRDLLLWQWPDAVGVHLKELGALSLDIEVTAWFQVADSEFPAIRQEMLIRFMEEVEGAGTALAFPTRTVHVVSRTPPEATASGA